MTAYAIAQLHDVHPGPEIAEYLRRVDATLAPYQGRFLVHGATPEVLEPGWSGDIVVVAFPDMEAARRWYASEAYQAILPLRTRNSRATVILLEGVTEGYRAADFAEKLTA